MESKTRQTGQQISIAGQDADISGENDETLILVTPPEPELPPEPPPLPPPPPPRIVLGTGIWINLTDHSLECVRVTNPSSDLLNTIRYMLLVETSSDIHITCRRSFKAKAWEWFEEALSRIQADTEQFNDGNKLFNFLFFTNKGLIDDTPPMPLELDILQELMPFIKSLHAEQKQEVFSWTKPMLFKNDSNSIDIIQTNALFVVIHTFYQSAHRVIGYPHGNQYMIKEYSAFLEMYSSILHQLISQISTLPETSQEEIYSHLFPTEDFQPRDDEHNHSQNLTMMPYDIIRTVIYIYSALYDKDPDNYALLAFSERVKRFSHMAIR